MSDEPYETDIPAERGLERHLELLRSDGPEPGRDLVRRVVRSARWQRVLRPPLRVAGMIASSVLDGLGALVGRTRNRP